MEECYIWDILVSHFLERTEKCFFILNMIILSDALRDLVPFVQFNVKNTYGGVLLLVKLTW